MFLNPVSVSYTNSNPAHYPLMQYPINISPSTVYTEIRYAYSLLYAYRSHEFRVQLFSSSNDVSLFQISTRLKMDSLLSCCCMITHRKCLELHVFRNFFFFLILGGSQTAFIFTLKFCLRLNRYDKPFPTHNIWRPYTQSHGQAAKTKQIQI